MFLDLTFEEESSLVGYAVRRVPLSIRAVVRGFVGVGFRLLLGESRVWVGRPKSNRAELKDAIASNPEEVCLLPGFGRSYERMYALGRC